MIRENIIAVSISRAWGFIWSAVVKRFDRLFVNGQMDDRFAQWLAERGLIEWKPQRKCMWLRLSSRMENDFMNTWHIPYFDWI